MLSKSQIQYLKSLQQKKFREKYSAFVVEGPKLVSEVLKSDFSVSGVFAIPQWIEKNFRLIGTVKTVEVAPRELERISGLKTPNNVIAVVQIPDSNPPKEMSFDIFLLAVDGIKDPGNLGSIIRTAEWFGFKTLICSNDSVEVYNPKVVQSTMGSLFRVKVYYTDLPKYLEELEHDYSVFGAFLDGENIYKQSFAKRGILVIGSESHGIRPAVARKIKNRLHIPAIAGSGESLNASVATAICCSEIKRSFLKNI